MKNSIWSLPNKLKDVDRAVRLHDPLRGQLAAHELLVRLHHAQVAWREIATTALGAASSPPGKQLSTLLDVDIQRHAESLLEHLRDRDISKAGALVRMPTDSLNAADAAWDQVADR